MEIRLVKFRQEETLPTDGHSDNNPYSVDDEDATDSRDLPGTDDGMVHREGTAVTVPFQQTVTLRSRLLG
ncbi:hypothetical protein NFX46_38315 [Streptomyces phaeoluteigriseus]|uniref:Uncharacterized protein n=1 Tax=Streptomyces phaeoluteigriseus TaxID=114686 RepID=A0ABY4ZJB9_9ACTN|nr:hypothetical protein [Streptomyces phaeoluteigriseus]USQ89091.1 hypothetical protein NFX46_38315 [Streptomyces phaeoluteigriseus]